MRGEGVGAGAGEVQKNIHQKSPEVISSRVLFYLGENVWEGHTTDIGLKVFTPVEFFGA